MIFLTLGTYPLPFDRLVRAVDELAEQEIIDGDDMYGQIGHSNYVPKYIKYERLIDKERFDSLCQTSSALVSHGGIGTITMALKYQKPLLTMPRLKRFGEVVNDHQVGTVREFERMGHVLAAYSVEELPSKIVQLKTFVPAPRTAQPEKVAERIRRFLEEIAKK